MDFVGTDHHIVSKADLGHPFQLLPLKDPAHWIVRVAQDKNARPVGNGRFKGLKINDIAPVRLPRKLHFVTGKPGVGGGVQDGRVNRRLYQHSISGRGKGMTGLVKAPADSRQKQQRLGRHRPAVESLQSLHHHLAEFRRLHAVAKHAVFHTLAEGAEHRLRGTEVHVCHPEGQHVLVITPPLVAI